MFIPLTNIKNDKPFEVKGNINNDWVKSAFSDLDIVVEIFDFSLKLTKKKDFVEVSGDFKAIIKLNCVRCLNSFEKEIIDKDFKIYLYKEGISNDSKELKLNERDLDFSFIKGDVIDLAEVLREQLIIDLPDYPLCNASCVNTCNCSNDLDKTCKNAFSKLKNLKLKD
jgi:uncharacterized protein